jgi:CheY-like chemotaxis protein
VDRLEGDHAQEICQAQKTPLKGNADHGITATYEKEFIRKDSSRVPILIGGTTFIEKPDEGVSFVLDPAEHKKREQKFHEAQEMESFGTLAGGIAHDFKIIPGAILGNALREKGRLNLNHALYENPNKDPEGRPASEAPWPPDTHFWPEPVGRQVISLAPIIEEALRLLRPTLPVSVEIVRSVGSDLPNILGNSTQIHQVFLNLCTHAWQAMEGNRGQIEVRIESVFLGAAQAAVLDGIRSGHFVCLSVSGMGKGMDEAMRQRIFEPFFNTKPVRERSVHDIVQDKESAIKVVSRLYQGTTFFLYFPSVQHAPGEPTPIEPFESPCEKALNSPRGRGQHVLYLDDEESLAYLATELLEGLGYRVTAFTSSADCLQAFRASPEQFDLIVTDFNMPGASGLQVAVELLKLRPDIPVVLSSGYLTEDQKESARRIGIREIIYKPSTVEELSAAIDRLACA